VRENFDFSSVIPGRSRDDFHVPITRSIGVLMMARTALLAAVLTGAAIPHDTEAAVATNALFSDNM
jgi:hypothetical protein